MKRKIGFTAIPMPKNWVRALYIIWKRKLRKINPDLMIGIVAVVILLLQVFIIVTAVKGQERPKGLQIGDKVPDVTITNIINHPTGTAKISDFKGKLLILDFWATWCGSCISSMPKTADLQQQFSPAIQILHVTSESRSRIKDFLATNAKLKGLKVTTATADTQLKKLFPHRILPHAVWIEGNGIVIAITGSHELNAQNIKSKLKGSAAKLHQKKDVMQVETFSLAEMGDKPRLYSSTITGHINGLPAITGRSKDTVNNTTRIYGYNLSIPLLYTLAYPRLKRMPKNRIILDVSDSGSYYPEFSNLDSRQWNKEHMYCYELVVPSDRVDELDRFVKQDLDRFFNLNSRFEKRTIPALVLREDGRTLKRSLPDGASEDRLSDDGNVRHLRNYPVSQLVSLLNYLKGLPPIT